MLVHVTPRRARRACEEGAKSDVSLTDEALQCVSGCPPFGASCTLCNMPSLSIGHSDEGSPGGDCREGVCRCSGKVLCDWCERVFAGHGFVTILVNPGAIVRPWCLESFSANTLA